MAGADEMHDWRNMRRVYLEIVPVEQDSEYSACVATCGTSRGYVSISNTAILCSFRNVASELGLIDSQSCCAEQDARVTRGGNTVNYNDVT